jgi:hypothetical protein
MLDANSHEFVTAALKEGLRNRTLRGGPLACRAVPVLNSGKFGEIRVFLIYSS